MVKKATLLNVFLLLIIGYLLFSNNSFKAIIKNNELAKLDTIEYYKNKLGLTVAEKLTYKGTAEQLEVYLSEKTKESDQFKEESKGWRKKFNALQIKLVFVLDSVDVLFNKPVPYNFERTFEKLTKDYYLKGIANQNGLSIDFRAKAEVTSFTGIKPFSNQSTTSITSSTDALRVSGFDNFQFVNKQKKWGIGLSFGLGFYHKYTFTGITINRNFLLF
ncbi:hypothetical protein [Tenacibaculum soleae]|uniref:hypothetical protein n=1 Tax=Tenacibaculum soleae TaxID=447689 RepID=UPI0023015C4C|nr:hypothetical protein [Tenacibaculum soleae]